MILKKPYALLIKYFKIIHIILAIIFSYLIYKTNLLLQFFNSYVNTNGSVSITESEIHAYISPYVYIFIIALLIFDIIIYLLMRYKNKPKFFYAVSPIIYILVLIVFSYSSNVLEILLTDTISPVTSRAIRDILIIALAIQIPFAVFSFLRGIGFDVKKFNFKKDIVDLQISELDNEEVEINLNVEKYKVKRSLKRKFRNIKYLILEHKLFVFSIILIIFVYFCYNIINNIFFINKTYPQNTIVTLDKYSIIVGNAYLTNTNQYGKVISNDSNYVAVKITINSFLQKNKFDIEKLSLVVNNKAYSSYSGGTSDFYDLGNVYNYNELSTTEKNDYLFLFKIPNNININKVYLKYLNGSTYKGNDIIYNYKKVKLIINDKRTKKYMDISKINDSINIDDTKVKITKYEIANSFEYNYNYCIKDDDCIDSIGFVSPSKGNTKILKLTLNSNLSNHIKSNINSISEFISLYSNIIYNINNKEYSKEIYNLTPKGFTKNVYFEVPNNVENSNILKLSFNVRNTIYTYILKSE